MSGTPNKPLNPFRRQEPPTSSKPLHSRWGDVAITVPTEGSWSQYNNPHRRGRKGYYGPGYVSEYAARRPHPRRHRRHPSDSNNNDDENNNENDEASKHTASTTPPPTASSSHRTHNPGRKSISNRRRPVSLNSRPTPSPAESNETEEIFGQERLVPDQRPDFAYKPISLDYPTEIAESQGSQLHRANANTASSSRFRYIPASARYRDEFGGIPARSGSKGSSSSSSSSCRSAGKRASAVSSTSSSASSKRLTTVMVPDAEDIYG
ncbi:hypothetical protein PHISP_04223 [Aspergillus sp. HF37]|nr:hypothetical protein PHISP_04223 [Aspergillus sp. HF37]